MIDANEIELDGKIYVTEETDTDNDCSGCAFRCIPACCAGIMCYSEDRADGRTVIFVEKKEKVQLNNGASSTEDKSIDIDKSITNNAKTESLDSLFNQIVLLQKENDSLVGQKEQLVNKISANTQTINILKDKMQLRLNQIGSVFVGNDKVDVVEEEEILDITDWRDLKVGDIVNIYGEDLAVCEIEGRYYDGDYTFAVMPEDQEENWVDVTCDKWKFVSRPNK